MRSLKPAPFLNQPRLRSGAKETNIMQDLFWFGLPIALSLATAAWAPLSPQDLEHLTKNN